MFDTWKAADRVLRTVASRFGYQPVVTGVPADMGMAFVAKYRECQPFTMTSVERLYALAESVQFVVNAEIPGDFVECGVWKGGSALMIARSLSDAGGDQNRRIWLYDTFKGMSEPTHRDGRSAHERWTQQARGTYNEWCFSPLDEVQAVLARSSFSPNLLRFVTGKVEDTIPNEVPDAIAVLRLDTDWYESTRHELVHLWPRLSPGGILLIDDYGHWEGARRAVDEFFESKQVLMHRVDYTGRTVQKPFTSASCSS
jgi:hypothetical protein